MTSLPGAPKHEESLSATVEPTPFFDSTSFYPHVGSGADTRASKQLDEYREKLNPIVSGHDHELPGQDPWKVFMFGTMLLGSVWILAAIYQLLDANNLMTWFTRFGIQTFDSGAQVHPVDPLQQHMTSLLQSWSVSQDSAAEQLDISLPFSHIAPHGLSCDATGSHFAVTDGLSTFVGKVSPRRSLR